MILLHKVHLVCMGPADNMQWLVSLVILRAVLVVEVRSGGCQAGWFSMSVAWETLGKCVPHLQLAVGHAAHGGLVLVERAVDLGAFGSRRESIVLVVTWQLRLVERGVEAAR